MTVYGEAIPNGVEYVIAWQRPVGECNRNRPAGDVLPYCMVNGVTWEEDENLFTGEQVISTHTFAATYEAASDAAAVRHARMKLLVRNPSLDVTVNGVVVNADYVDIAMGPTEVPYSDNTTIFRFVARYKLGFSSFATP